MTRVDVIAGERLLDDRQHWHELQDFWRDGPVALVFLRQFGSAFALKQARDLSRRHDEVRDAGGQVVLIGLGSPIQGFTFRKRAESRFPVLTTRDRALYRTMGLRRMHGLAPLLVSALPMARLVREGIYPYQPTGDNDLLGGVFVVSQGGREVPWEFRTRWPCDVAPAADVVDALARASSSQLSATAG